MRFSAVEPPGWELAADTDFKAAYESALSSGRARDRVEPPVRRLAG
jgi:hypothetical protein